jgi:hypothetical protein
VCYIHHPYLVFHPNKTTHRRNGKESDNRLPVQVVSSTAAAAAVTSGDKIKPSAKRRWKVKKDHHRRRQKTDDCKKTNVNILHHLTTATKTEAESDLYHQRSSTTRLGTSSFDAIRPSQVSLIVVLTVRRLILKRLLLLQHRPKKEYRTATAHLNVSPSWVIA